MNILVGAENTQLQGDINATQVYGNVYNGPTEVTQNNYHGGSWKGIDLLHQHTSPAALLDARARRDPPRCMEGTREAIIQEILEWLKKVTDSSSILWLRGPAGHGKTALEFTLAEICRRKGLLIGSFFFSNRIVNCSDANLLFATLAAELIQACPFTKYYINKAICDDPHIFNKALETQMKALIIEPLQRIATLAHIDTVTRRKLYPTLIVIDGLDECADLDDQDEIIRIIGDLVQQLRLPLRFLIASRPEPNLCEAFETLQSRLSKDFSTLLLTDDALTRRDIQTFLEIKFIKLRARHVYLPAGWPGPDIIMRLVDKASGQFVYATTIIIYVSSRDDRPDDRLDVILKLLDTPVGDTPYAPLDQLYSYIVRSVKHRKEVLLILGQLILAKEMSNEEDILGSPSNSTSQKRIEVILNLRVGDVKRLLNSLHSVIDVSENLKLLHTSFQDFLLDASRSKDFVVNLPEARVMLGSAYIQAICIHAFEIFTNTEPARKFKPDLANMHKALQNNLGHSFSHPSEHTRDPADISSAVMMSSFRSAVELTHYDHPNLTVWLCNLATSLPRLFECTGNLIYISSAISAQQWVVQLTPDDHADIPLLLDNLGNSFLRRFERTGDVADISFAILAQWKAVKSAPNGHTDTPLWLSNLGNSFSQRFGRTRDLDDISSAILFQQRAVQSTPDGHSDMPLLLSKLGNSFSQRFEQIGNVDDLSKAVSIQRRVVQLTPNGHTRISGRLNGLGDALVRRFQHIGHSLDVDEAIIIYRHCATTISAPPSIRLRAALRWAELSISRNPLESLHAYDSAICLISQIAGMDQTFQQRYANLINVSYITATAASAAFAQSELQMALEWLEQGRCIVWNQLKQLRTPIDDLRVHDESLADHFLKISWLLESSASLESLQEWTTVEPFQKSTMFEHIAIAAGKWTRLLEKIRFIPGFCKFLKPFPASAILKNIPQDGAVVLINVHEDRCDALALIPGADIPLHIPLVHFTLKKALELIFCLRGHLSPHGTRGVQPVKKNSGDRNLRHILQELWVCVVKPILDALAFPEKPHPFHLPRIWWCPTGPLVFLPIHAAGTYNEESLPSGPCVSDFVISSYIPTVGTLLEKVKASAVEQPTTSKVLLVSQVNAPGGHQTPGTILEAKSVMKILGTDSCIHLEESAATVNRVKQEMGTCNWVHFACSGNRNVQDPLKSGMSLHDGRLELLDIMQLKIPQCKFAFLSACQTAAGDERLHDEAVHLVAGMLAAGCQGVVGTMWSVRDRYGAVVAKSFYEYLAEKRNDSDGGSPGDPRVDSSKAAYALHHAVQGLRQQIGDTEKGLLTWIPYVHFGL